MGEAKQKRLQMAMGATEGRSTSSQITLPERVVEFAARGFEGYWSLADKIRKNPNLLAGNPGEWQPWCYLPVNVAAAIVAHLLRDEVSIRDVETRMTGPVRLLTAASAWRMCKGVYVFDPAVIKALIETDADEEPPIELFFQLPEWCPYIATPGLELQAGLAIHGFFAYVDDRAHGQSVKHAPELNFEILVDPRGSANEDALFMAAAADNSVVIEAFRGQGKSEPVEDVRARVLEVARSREFIHWHGNVSLGTGSFLTAAKQNLVEVSAISTDFERRLNDVPEETTLEVATYFAQTYAKLGSILLYLVSDKADVPADMGQAMAGVRANERRGIRNFQARQIRQWDIGFRIGAEIRAYAERLQADALGTLGQGKRPHVRRAHWHSFWVGPRDKPDARKKRVRWLPPIPVNVESSDNLVPTMHRVAKEVER